MSFKPDCFYFILDQFDSVLATNSKSPYAMVSPKPVTPLEEVKEEITPRASSLTPTRTPTPTKASPEAPDTADESSLPPPTASVYPQPHTALLPTPDVPPQLMSQPPPGYDQVAVPGVPPGASVDPPQATLIPGPMLPTIQSYPLPPTSLPQIVMRQPDDALAIWDRYLKEKDDKKDGRRPQYQHRDHRDHRGHYYGTDRRPNYDKRSHYERRPRSRSPPPHPHPRPRR